MLSCEQDPTDSVIPVPGLKDDLTTIEMQVDDNSLHVVDVQVGHVVDRFVVDSGAELSAINSNRFSALTLTKRKLVWVATTIGIPRPRWSGYIRQSVSIGGHQLPGVRWIKSDFRGPLREFAGVLGRDALQQFVLQLEYSSGSTRLITREAFASLSDDLLKSQYTRTSVTADARMRMRIGGTEIPVLLDLGKNFSIELAEPPSSAVFVGDSILPVADFFGRTSALRVYEVPTVEVGRFEHNRVSIEVPERLTWWRRPKHAIVGVAFLRTADWYIDLTGGELWYRPSATARYDRFSGTAIEIEGRMSEESDARLVVTKIPSRSPLYWEFGVRDGDEIVTVNGSEPFTIDSTGATGNSTPEFMKLLWLDFETVTIRRDGEIIEISQRARAEHL